MSLKVGIVGLPNVGKSCIFNALTQAGARVANFPFCTVDPNHGIVPLPDPRLAQLVDLLSPPTVTPATLEVVDIAGLVKGAHLGEGLGNQFLANIREVDALLHVLRCFAGEVTHVSGQIDPQTDLDVVELELQLADLAAVEQRQDKIAHEAQVGVKEARAQQAPLQRFAEALQGATALRGLELDEADRQQARELGLLTDKPVLYVANCDERQIRDADDILAGLRQRLSASGDALLELQAELESEIAQLDEAEERAMFLADLGVQEPGLDRLTRAAYDLLGLITFYTFVGGKELRAWSVPRDTPAPRAAGRIHTDFERGFIRAEVTAFDDFVSSGGEAVARKAGLLRSEGKDYLVQDGDVVHFRFNL
ncbi:MAG: redox-regulated ATPase YchF [Deltaproteobacteria bacterium]|nr:redox-regulated ATPase YchF [Deltaproteobacteria bacterium]